MVIGIGTKIMVKGIEDGYMRIVDIKLGCGPDLKWSTFVDVEINRDGFPSSITQARVSEITRDINKGNYTVIET